MSVHAYLFWHFLSENHFQACFWENEDIFLLPVKRLDTKGLVICFKNSINILKI